MINRRVFVRDGGLAVVGLSFIPGFLQRTVAAAGTTSRQKVLVVIFQRGGADGLNIVVPFAEKAYYAYRPSIAIAPPGKKPDTALDLDGSFGLHPALAPLHAIYQKNQLAIINAVGSSDPTRSHFQAQDRMESAGANLSSGWLNRYLQSEPDPKATAFRGVAMGVTLPRTLRGGAPALALGAANQFDLQTAGELYESVYQSESNTLLSGASREMFAAIAMLRKASPGEYKPADGVNYQNNVLGRGLRQVAQLIKADVGLQVACIDIGGWDTHAGQGSTTGRLPNVLGQFGRAIAAFHKDMGDRMEDVVVLTMSEFGRTARENGNQGTDHGNANVMFLMGGAVKGGRIYGTWPGLEKEQLNEDRDLALTTDYREVFAHVLSRHLGCRNLKTVFPGLTIDPKRFTEML